MRARAAVTPIALVVLAAAAAAYAYLVDRRTVSDSDRAARKNDVFPSFRADQVMRVELEQGPNGFALDRDADAGADASLAWVLTSPRHELADPAAVDLLLRELELATRLRAVTETGALGLDAPRVRGSVTIGALRYRFALGRDTPRPEGGAYMRVEGEGTFVVDRPLKIQLLRGADAYRNRSIVPFGASEVARIDVRAEGGLGFELLRSGDGFRVTGARLRASRSAVEHLFAALAESRADSFLDDTQSEPLSSSGITVTLAPRDSSRSRIQLHVGGPCPGQPDEVAVVRTLERSESADAQVDPPWRSSVCTAKTLVEALRATPETLVDLFPLSFHADEIEQLRLETVSSGGPRIELARKGSGWHERAPEDRDLSEDENESANNLAAALANSRALSARPAAPDERLVARSRVIVVGTGGSSEIVEVGALEADGTVSARRLDDGAILRLPRAAARRFEPHLVALRSRAVWLPAFDAGAVVAIVSGCGPMPESLELRNGSWVMRSPAGFEADSVTVADLTQAMSHARAEAWVAEQDDGSFGFDRRESCTVTLTLDGATADAAPRRESLVFGADSEDGVYARTLGNPAVFVAPKVLRDLASRPAVDRSRLHLDPSALESVALGRGRAHLVLERVGERLVRRMEEAPATRDDDKIETALAGFYAQAVLHTGPPARDEGMDRPTLEIVAKAVRVDGRARQTHIVVGAPGRFGGSDVYFVRASGVDATFAVPRRVVNEILDAW